MIAWRTSIQTAASCGPVSHEHRPLLNKPPPFNGLSIKIPIIIPINGTGFLNCGSSFVSGQDETMFCLNVEASLHMQAFTQTWKLVARIVLSSDELWFKLLKGWDIGDCKETTTRESRRIPGV